MSVSIFSVAFAFYPILKVGGVQNTFVHYFFFAGCCWCQWYGSLTHEKLDRERWALRRRSEEHEERVRAARKPLDAIIRTAFPAVMGISNGRITSAHGLGDLFRQQAVTWAANKSFKVLKFEFKFPRASSNFRTF